MLVVSESQVPPNLIQSMSEGIVDLAISEKAGAMLILDSYSPTLDTGHTNDPDTPWDGGAYDLGGGDHFLPDGWYTYVLEWGAIQNGIWTRDVKHGRVLLAR